MKKVIKAAGNVITARAKLSIMEKKINWLLRNLEDAGVKIRGPRRIIEKNGVVLDLGYGKKFKVTTTGRIQTTAEVKDTGFGKKLLSLNKQFNREFPREAAALEQGEAPELNRSYKPPVVEDRPRAAEQSPRGWTPEKRAQQAQRMRERQARWAEERERGQQLPAARPTRNVTVEEPAYRQEGPGNFSIDYNRAAREYRGPQEGMDVDLGKKMVTKRLRDIEFNPDSPGAGPAREARRQRAFMDRYASLDDNRIQDDGGYGEFASSKKVKRKTEASTNAALDKFNSLNMQVKYSSGSKDIEPFFTTVADPKQRSICPPDMVVFATNKVIIYGGHSNKLTVKASSPEGVTCYDLWQGITKLLKSEVTKAYPRAKTNGPNDMWSRHYYFEGLEKYKDGYRMLFGT